MASVSSNSGEALVVGGWTAGDEAQSNSDRYLARRLEAAGADYKGVALTNFLLGAAVAAAAWLAVGVLAEHWIVPGGLPRWVRWAWLAAGCVALVAAAVRWLLPLMRYRVNLVYAARAIEREHPELHNDLVNTVLVKAHPEGSTAVVVRSLEKRAAKRLADVPTEGIIDRSLAVRLAMVLAALVGIACLYELVAPKSLLVSAVRLVAPWAGISAPSRVRIEPPRLHWRMPGAGVVDPQQLDSGLDGQDVAVDRGSATLVRGRQLVLAAAVRGLRGGEQPVVLAVPLKEDGSHDPAATPWRIEMVRGAAEGEAAKAFTAFLPDATRGLENSIEITIAAGDARSEPVRLVVVDSPSLLVREVRYDFPAYIARDPETVAWQGDLRAPEETQVTLVAECNQPIEAAWIDFGCDGNRDLKMKVGASDLARASVTFPLRMNADRSAPEHAVYRLVFQPRGSAQGGREAVVIEPMEHRIEVVADLAPEVTIESPTVSPLAVPRDSPVPVRVRALDPDHALSRVVIETRIDGGRAVPPMPILEVAKQGPFKGTARLVPFNLGAEAGSVLQYRAVATDNRPQQPNVSVTPWQELKIDEKAPPQPDEPEPDFPKDSKKGRPGEDRSDESDRGDDGGDAEQDGGEQSEDGREGDRQEDGADGAEDGPGQRRPDDGGRDDGSSGDQDQQNQDQQKEDPQQRGAPADRKRPDRQRSDDGSNPPPPGEQGQPGASGGGDEQQGDGKQQRPGNDQSPKGSKPGKNGSPQQGADGGDSGDQQGSGQKPGSQPQGREGKGREQTGEDEGQGEGEQREGGEKPQPGAKPSPSGGAGKKRQNDAVAADGTNDGEAMDRILEHQRRESERGEAGETVKRQPKEGKQGEGQQGEGQKGEGQKGEGQKGEGQQGEGQQGEGQQGEGQKGEGQKGEGQKGEGEGSGGEGEQGEGGEKPGGKAKPGSDPSQQPKSPSGKAQAGGAEEGDQEGGGGADPQQPADGQPGSSASPTGSGGWSNGDGTAPDQAPRRDGDAPKTEAEWGDQDTAHARNAADLAVRALKDDLDKGRTELLDELGWTRDQARAFLQRWGAMRALEKSNDPVKRSEFDRAVRSLGLRPDGARSSRDVPADVKGGQAEGRRSRPPSEYREQFKAYTQGTSAE